MARFFSNNSNSVILSNSFNSTAIDDRSKILAWLSPLEPQLRHRDIGAQRVESVGDWLLETKEFQSWYHGSGESGSDHAMLFCYGHPGVGKSYITSLVIDNLCDRAKGQDIAVACFYFDFAAREEQSPNNMLGSLLKQLLRGLDEIPDEVVQEFHDQKKVIGGRELQVPGIVKLFEARSAKQRAFICVDALDECVPEHRMQVLDSLRQILRRSQNTRIFITGRPHIREEIKRRFGGTATSVSIEPPEGDIIRYLQSRLRNDTTPEVMSSSLKAEIIKSIPKAIPKTFLLVSLNIEAVLRETTISGRRRRLDTLTDGLDLGDAYGATIERIKAQGGEKAKLAITTLMWICHAKRPLQVNELCHALAVEIGSTDFDKDNVPLIATVISSCQGLVTVDKGALTVRLIHFTLREYLCARGNLFSRVHSTMAETCLTYLNSQKVKNFPATSLPDLQIMPFLKYSSRYWGIHAKMEFSDCARLLALELLNRHDDHISARLLLEQVMDTTGVNYVDASSLPTGLHCASFFGIIEIVTALIETRCYDINQRDCTGATPLLWAAGGGDEEVVKLLLGRGEVNPNRPNNRGITPLGYSALLGHEEVVKLLLGREDVDPDKPDSTGHTPLWYAVVQEYEGVVKLLLEREDVDPDRPDNGGLTPLWYAVVKGYEGIARLLLKREDVDPDRPDNGGLTPLWYAVVEGYEGIARLLLKREDVDPDRPHNGGLTPLWYAVVEGYEGIARLLLKREDVDPDRPDNGGLTPLWYAVVRGYEGIARLLLEREDVDPDRPNNGGLTPLWYAARNRYEGIVKLLQARKQANTGMI